MKGSILKDQRAKRMFGGRNMRGDMPDTGAVVGMSLDIGTPKRLHSENFASSSEKVKAPLLKLQKTLSFTTPSKSTNVSRPHTQSTLNPDSFAYSRAFGSSSKVKSPSRLSAKGNDKKHWSSTKDLHAGFVMPADIKSPKVHTPKLHFTRTQSFRKTFKDDKIREFLLLKSREYVRSSMNIIAKTKLEESALDVSTHPLHAPPTQGTPKTSIFFSQQRPRLKSAKKRQERFSQVIWQGTTTTGDLGLPNGQDMNGKSSRGFQSRTATTPNYLRKLRQTLMSKSQSKIPIAKSQVNLGDLPEFMSNLGNDILPIKSRRFDVVRPDSPNLGILGHIEFDPEAGASELYRATRNERHDRTDIQTLLRRVHLAD
eukprot:TRINITY_DN8019_c0_g1_i2.p1 TRINITY_DN8019_c0_g1~~TRINITY_DN8019_c0_g1_i2.p1  ORF type:complete len:370 (+),score=53.71 TRINITY_DN8019_c0_g1_i2:35-1144(+)